MSASRRALEAAVQRAYSLGRVDASIGIAAEELRRMVAAEPRVTPMEILRRYGKSADIGSLPDWDHTLWWVADTWCELYRCLHALPARHPPPSPYSVFHYALPAREAAPPER